MPFYKGVNLKRPQGTLPAAHEDAALFSAVGAAMAAKTPQHGVFKQRKDFARLRNSQGLELQTAANFNDELNHISTLLSKAETPAMNKLRTDRKLRRTNLMDTGL